MTLCAPVREFSRARYLTWLFLFWPAAVVYLVRHNQQRGRFVCLRITSQELVEASGFTLDLLEGERHRRPSNRPSRVVLSLLTLGAVAGLLLLIYVATVNG